MFCLLLYQMPIHGLSFIVHVILCPAGAQGATATNQLVSIHDFFGAQARALAVARA